MQVSLNSHLAAFLYSERDVTDVQKDGQMRI